MKTIVMILVLVWVTGCGKAEVQPEFQAYVDSFVSDAKQYNREVDVSAVTIKFGDTLSTENGAICHTGSKEIDVQKSVWANGDDMDHMIMIYHELGHCVLGKDHIDGLGIMHSNRIPSALFKLQPSVYLADFFQ